MPDAPRMDRPPAPAARDGSSQDASRPLDRLAIGSALLGGVLAAVVLAARVGVFGSAPSASPQALGTSAAPAPESHPPTARAAEPRATTASAASPSASVAPTASERLRVANTDGQGVVLRASPRADDRMPRGLMEGSWVTLLERRGPDWARVRSDDGQEGWVPARYLSR